MATLRSRRLALSNCQIVRLSNGFAENSSRSDSGSLPYVERPPLHRSRARGFGACREPSFTAAPYYLRAWRAVCGGRCDERRFRRCRPDVDACRPRPGGGLRGDQRVLRAGLYTRDRLIELLAERDIGYDPFVVAGVLAELPHIHDDEFAAHGLDELETAIMRARFADWYRMLVSSGIPDARG